MKILVTGGAGFIGSHIVDCYLNLKHKVVVIDNLSTGKKENLNPKAKFYSVDIRNKKAVGEIFAKENPDILNHHAAHLNVHQSVNNPVFDAEVNILGLLNLLEMARKAEVKKIIFASSGGVIYGEAKTIPTPENHPLQPISPYGVAKLTSEYYLSYYQKVFGISSLSLRYANIYGPRQDFFGETGVVAIFIKKMLSGTQPIINGDGKQTRDFTYVDDVVRANISALNKNITGAVNIGTGIETSIKKLFRLLSNLTATSLPEKYGPPKKGEQRRSSLDSTLARKLLRWKPSISLQYGLRETIKFFKILKHAK